MMPATNAVSERSFLALKQITTFLSSATIDKIIAPRSKRER